MAGGYFGAPTVRITPDLLRMIARMVDEQRISTEYHLLVVAHLCNVAYIQLSGLVKANYVASGKERVGGGGLTEAGKRLLDPVLTATHGPPPHRTLVDADFLLQIWRGGRAFIKQQRGLAGLAAGRPFSADTLKRYVRARSGDLSDDGKRLVLAKYPGFNFDRAASAAPSIPVAAPQPDLADVLMHLPASPGPAEEAEWDALVAPDPTELPLDLMDVRVEDLMPASPDPFVASASPTKRPRRDA